MGGKGSLLSFFQSQAITSENKPVCWINVNLLFQNCEAYMWKIEFSDLYMYVAVNLNTKR